MNKPGNRHRNRLILLLFVFAGLFGAQLGIAKANPPALFLTCILGAVLTSTLCSTDAVERGKPLPHALELLLFIFWGVASPIYAVFGRGLSRAVWGLGLVLALYLTIVLSFALGATTKKPVDSQPSMIMEYQGESIELTPGDWADFDDFKHDQGKLNEEQLGIIEGALVRAEIPTRTLTRSEMIDYAQGLVFPGFGTSSSTTRQSDGSLLWLESIEIPLQGKARKLVFRAVGEDYCLVDDFVWPDVSPPIRKAEIEGDTIRYFSFDEIQVREATSLQVGVGDK